MGEIRVAWTGCTCTGNRRRKSTLHCQCRMILTENLAGMVKKVRRYPISALSSSMIASHFHAGLGNSERGATASQCRMGLAGERRSAKQDGTSCSSRYRAYHSKESVSRRRVWLDLALRGADFSIPSDPSTEWNAT